MGAQGVFDGGNGLIQKLFCPDGILAVGESYPGQAGEVEIQRIAVCQIKLELPDGAKGGVSASGCLFGDPKLFLGDSYIGFIGLLPV